MKRFLQKLLITIWIATFLLSVTVQGAITADGVCVMHYDTGEIYYAQEGFVPRVPASMTKIMAMYCFYDALKNGEMNLDTVVPISENTYMFSRDTEFQGVQPFEYTETYTVDEMLDVIVVYSANAAAVAIAESLCGNEAAFVQRMNQKAVDLGIDAHFEDCYGGSPNNCISPYGMAILAQKIIKDYPDILVRSSKLSAEFKGIAYKNTNLLLSGDLYYPGTDGLKTGYTSAAGFCFCGTATKNNQRLIAVAMHADSAKSRFTDVAQLLDIGFTAINTVFFTNMKTYINGCEIPTFYHGGSSPHAVIVAEDLVRYGYDLAFNENIDVLTITRNSQKAYIPQAMEHYRNKNGQAALHIDPNKNVQVILQDNGTTHVINDVYCTAEGYTCISVDAFQSIYPFVWDYNTCSAYIM